jgi:hypothetical protein
VLTALTDAEFATLRDTLGVADSVMSKHLKVPRTRVRDPDQADRFWARAHLGQPDARRAKGLPGPRRRAPTHGHHRRPDLGRRRTGTMVRCPPGVTKANPRRHRPERGTCRPHDRKATGALPGESRRRHRNVTTPTPGRDGALPHPCRPRPGLCHLLRRWHRQPFENAGSQEISAGWPAPGRVRSARHRLANPPRPRPSRRSAGIEQTEDEERLRHSTRSTPQIG